MSDQDDDTQDLNEDGSATVDLPDPDIDVEEQSDGSAVVHMEFKGPEDTPDFYENLAAKVPDWKMGNVVSDYLRKIDEDKEARKKRDEQYEEGLKRTGMGKEAPGGAQFEGASKAVHPVMLEACVDFASRAIKELFPPDGPVKTKIIGEADDAKLEIADRKAEFNNWQLTEQIEEFRDEQEILFTQLPLGGSQYMLIYWDAQKKRPAAEFVPVDNVLIPFACNSFYTAQRITHVQDLTEFEMQRRVETGLYVDEYGSVSSMMPEPTASEKANQKVEGKEDLMNIDGVRRVYHCYTWLEIEEDGYSKGKKAPYILMMDDTENRCLGLYRNWENGDDTRKKLDWIIEYKFIPWRGALGVGLPQMIGSLAGGATGALRALLDSAHINNAATIVSLKGARLSGQSQTLEVTEFTELESGPALDDIRKAIMPMPFNPPSPMLFQLLGFLVDAAKGVVTTSEEKIADATSQMPVGTTQALIEQGAAVYSAVHARLHRSQQRALMVLNRINRWYLDDMEKGDMPPDLVVKKTDFVRNSDVIPVSDPHIFSETQRISQNQSVLQLVQQFPQLFDPREVVMRTLKQLKVPDINKLMPDKIQAQEINAAEENCAMSMGHMGFAYPGQDHIAHIQVHLMYALDPVFGSNPIIAPTYIKAALEHIKQHIVMWYRDEINRYAGHGETVDLNKYQNKKMTHEIDDLILVSARHVQLDTKQILAGLLPSLSQMMQLAQHFAPKPQQDPVLQASLAETQRRAAQDQKQDQFNQAKLQTDAQLKQAEITQKSDAEQKRREVDVAENAENNLTKERIKAAELSSEHLLSHEDQLHEQQERRAATLSNVINPGAPS